MNDLLKVQITQQENALITKVTTTDERLANLLTTHCEQSGLSVYAYGNTNLFSCTDPRILSYFFQELNQLFKNKSDQKLCSRAIEQLNIEPIVRSFKLPKWYCVEKTQHSSVYANTMSGSNIHKLEIHQRTEGESHIFIATRNKKATDKIVKQLRLAGFSFPDAVDHQGGMIEFEHSDRNQIAQFLGTVAVVERSLQSLLDELSASLSLDFNQTLIPLKKVTPPLVSAYSSMRTLYKSEMGYPSHQGNASPVSKGKRVSQ